MVHKVVKKIFGKKKLIVGTIGMGFISKVHMEAFQKRKDVRVKAICDINQNLLFKKNRELGIAETYPDYRFMLRDKEIDVVDVMTPHYIHKQCVCDSLRAGKTVICEKPLTIKAKDIEEIIKVSHSTKKLVYVKQYLRSSLAYQKALYLLNKGIIGTPYFATCVFTGNSVKQYLDPYTWRGNLVESGGGVFTDIGVHMLDLLQVFFDCPKSVFAQTAKISSTLTKKAEDLASVILDYPNKMLVNLSCTHNDKGFGFRWEIHIYGREGVINIIDEKGKQEKVLRVIKENKVVYEFRENDWWRKANIRVIHDILDRIKKNREPDVSLEHAKYVIKTIEAVYKSSRQGRKISL